MIVLSAQAAYLAKAGKSVAVLERRHVLGGAAVTEEIVPGFKFSRASYLVSLLRPKIVKDLELKVQVRLGISRGGHYHATDTHVQSICMQLLVVLILPRPLYIMQ